MSVRTVVEWKCGESRLTAGVRTLVMGVLNVTPDSFSDGGKWLDPEMAVEHGLEMAGQGADIVDVGGESTRPGAEPVSADEEARRVAPVIEALRKRTEVLISVDTSKASVAELAVQAGARIINDVSGLTADPAMLGVVRDSGVGVVVMHMQGTPRTMQQAPKYGDALGEVAEWLEARLAALTSAGLAMESLAVDPGIGFGKTLGHNLQLLNGIGRFARLGRPVVVGLSRKSFIGRLTGRETGGRLAGSLAAMTAAVLGGAHVVRVHDVAESRDAALVADAVLAGGRFA